MRVITNIEQQGFRVCIKAVSDRTMNRYFANITPGITLNGFNLEVATAAGNAGFNTYDHAGLFDLIWAVKRVALRASKNTNLDQRPPKDPVYPDRFRPSGLGDNTKRKRSTQQIAPPATRAMALVPTIEVRQGERRIFRYKNKKLSTRSNRVNAPTSFGYGSGTQEHPIELLHDDHDASLTAPKRQKLDNSTAPNNKQIANISYPRSVREHRQRSSVNANPTIQHTEDASTDSMHVDGYTYVRTSGRSSDAHDVHRDSIELQSVSDDLSKVKDVLAATAKDMIWCNKSMSNAFDNHRNILAGQGIHPILEKLCKDINGAKTSSIEGVEHLEDVLELLG